jgi:hypothetical protein
MKTLPELYDDHARECMKSAERMDDPVRRLLLLRMASEWQRDAAALRAPTQPTKEGSAPKIRTGSNATNEAFCTPTPPSADRGRVGTDRPQKSAGAAPTSSSPDAAFRFTEAVKRMALRRASH